MKELLCGNNSKKYSLCNFCALTKCNVIQEALCGNNSTIVGLTITLHRYRELCRGSTKTLPGAHQPCWRTGEGSRRL